MAIANLICSNQRRELLKKIGRFDPHPNMTHRFSVFDHSRFTGYFTIDLLEELRRAKLSSAKKIMATCSGKFYYKTLIHDDLEGQVGIDVSSFDKLHMSQEDFEKRFGTLEENVNGLISFFKSHGFREDEVNDYCTLLLEVEDKNDLGSQMISYADKCEGLAEAIHEALSGNEEFIEVVIPNYETVFEAVLPQLYHLADVYAAEGKSIPKYTSMGFKRIEKLVKDNIRVHEVNNLRDEIGIPVYDQFKSSILLRRQPSDLELLVKRSP